MRSKLELNPRSETLSEAGMPTSGDCTHTLEPTLSKRYSADREIAKICNQENGRHEGNAL